MALAPGSRYSHYSESAESDDIQSETSLLTQAVSKQVVFGDFVLKVNKKLKGSCAWDQFCLVWDPTKNEEVYGIACCVVCMSCLLYKKSANETKMLIRERSATLVAAAHLPYHFVELESLKNFAQAFIDLGAAYVNFRFYSRTLNNLKGYCE